MKNYLFWAIAVIAITFSSCKDDDEKDALSGTTWVCNEEVPGFDDGFDGPDMDGYADGQ